MQQCHPTFLSVAFIKIVLVLTDEYLLYDHRLLYTYVQSINASAADRTVLRNLMPITKALNTERMSTLSSITESHLPLGRADGAVLVGVD
jgi:hypothetical protein